MPVLEKSGLLATDSNQFNTCCWGQDYTLLATPVVPGMVQNAQVLWCSCGKLWVFDSQDTRRALAPVHDFRHARTAQAAA